MSFGFHYFLCKWWAYSTVFFLAPLFSILICLISLLSEYIKCISHVFIFIPTFVLVLDIYLNMLNAYHQALPLSSTSSHMTHYLLASALRDLLSVFPPPPSLCVLLQLFNFFTVLITSWACLICLLFIFCLHKTHKILSPWQWSPVSV